MNQTVILTIALAVILALVVLILVLKHCREIEKHDNDVIRQYNQKMDAIRTERLKEAQRKLREVQQKQTHYTTYNEREDMTAAEKYELAHYAKWRFDPKRRKDPPAKYK